MLLMILISIICIGNFSVFYSSRQTARFQDGRLLLVNIPEYAYEDLDLKKIEADYRKASLKMLLVNFIVYLPLILINDQFKFIYYFIMVWVNVFLINLPFKKYRDKLLKLKKERDWLDSTSKTIKVDLKMLAYMEKQPFNYHRYLIVLVIDLLTCGWMLYFHANLINYLYLLLQFVVLIGGMIMIKRLDHKTYCQDTDINITLNTLRIDYISHCFFLLILFDSIFNLTLQLFLLDQLPFVIIVLIMIGMSSNLLLIIYKTNQFQSKKKELLNATENKEYNISNDDCWRYGIFGYSYYNKADPKMFTNCGSQMIFNSAKPAYKYFIVSLIMIFASILIFIFGYPLYLDYHHQLVDLSLNHNIISVDSPFYQTEIDLDNVYKAELTDNLGDGMRINGTGTIAYTKGKCTYDKYGKCLVYKANLHDYFIVLYTDSNTYIINDDNDNKTIKIYREIKEVINQ
ncbi:PH domain-containing protein [Thomasclavelia sp.]|uniref:PH domain-containing protein n=1 Tax=Thomasclavelia sp. TaxID=3025757 RepID=UPI0025EF80A1|nr:PH domain-containing protein [Thomasclavelia sp.]